MAVWQMPRLEEALSCSLQVRDMVIDQKQCKHDLELIVQKKPTHLLMKEDSLETERTVGSQMRVV